jgi:hypothetical protein
MAFFVLDLPATSRQVGHVFILGLSLCGLRVRRQIASSGKKRWSQHMSPASTPQRGQASNLCQYLFRASQRWSITRTPNGDTVYTSASCDDPDRPCAKDRTLTPSRCLESTHLLERHTSDRLEPDARECTSTHDVDGTVSAGRGSTSSLVLPLFLLLCTCCLPGAPVCSDQSPE